MSKRSVAVILILGLIVGAFTAAPAEAGKKGKKNKKVTRVAEGSYIAPATVVGSCTQSEGIGCMAFPTAATEQYLTAKVTDESGQPVFVTVQADLDGDNRSETFYGSFCGETTEPIQFDGGAELIFWVGPLSRAPDRVLAGCVPGQGTEGALEVTFSNLP